MRWFVTTVLGVLGALLVAIPVAAGGECELSVEPVDAGGFHTVLGTGFAPNEEVELEVFLDDQPAFPEPVTRTADGTGTVSDGLTFTDADPVGDYVIRATADSCTAETTLHWSGLPDTATEAPATQDGLPIGLALAVISGALVFAYLMIRPTRITGKRDQ